MRNASRECSALRNVSLTLTAKNTSLVLGVENRKCRGAPSAPYISH